MDQTDNGFNGIVQLTCGHVIDKGLTVSVCFAYCMMERIRGQYLLLKNGTEALFCKGVCIQDLIAPAGGCRERN